MTWPEAMGLVVIEGLVIAVLVLTGFRTAIFRAVPEGLKPARRKGPARHCKKLNTLT